MKVVLFCGGQGMRIREYSDKAQLFDIAAIPVAVAITPEGKELARIENFIEPSEFQRRLSELRPRLPSPTPALAP